MNPKHPPGPPMTLGNMRELGVHHLTFCLDDACRHQALIDVSKYPDDLIGRAFPGPLAPVPTPDGLAPLRVIC
jgi:hypothetical protein